MEALGTDARFWIGIGVLFVLVVGGGVAVMCARRNAKAPGEDATSAFTLADLRRLHERGEITQREFETARDAIIQRTRQSANRERERRGGTDWGGGDPGRSARR